MTIGEPDLRRWRALDALDRAGVEAMQLDALRAQVRWLQANPWHGPRLRAAGVDAESLRTLDDLRRLPTMGKVDVLADGLAHPPFGTRLGVPATQVRDIMTSGGTSGNPPETYAYTDEDLEYTTDLYAMDQYRKGARPGDVAMMVSQIGMLTSPPLNVRAWERIGLPVLRVGPNSTEERVTSFARFRPAIVKLPYAYAPRFMAALRDAGIDPRAGTGMKFVFVSGGAYPVAFAQGVQEFFGAPMHEVFGCSQAGAVTAGTCEHGVLRGDRRGVLHCYDHAFVTEVLDPDGDTPVRPGDEGELVITQLWRRASPVLRYRMGDRVRYLGIGQCACGRPLAALECGTIARYDDMMRVKGVNMWAHDVDAHVLACDGVDDFNGVLSFDGHGRERAAVRVELRPGASAADVAARLSRNLKRAFHVLFDVEVVAPGTIERFELKQRRWRDERMAGTAGGTVPRGGGRPVARAGG
jgi:phenylacetate-CoA ligase